MKESDKGRSKHIYQSFEAGQLFIFVLFSHALSLFYVFFNPEQSTSCPQSAVHTGQVKVPPGYHPIDVEKEWGRLHVAMLERERLLRIEFERYQFIHTVLEKDRKRI